jgi:hypothetical protein
MRAKVLSHKRKLPHEEAINFTIFRAAGSLRTPEKCARTAELGTEAGISMCPCPLQEQHA